VKPGRAAGPGSADPGGTDPGSADPGGADPGGADSGCVDSGGAPVPGGPDAPGRAEGARRGSAAISVDPVTASTLTTACDLCASPVRNLWITPVHKTPACGFARGHGAESPFVTQSPSAERSPTVYRGGSALAFGGIIAALCVASAVDLVVEVGTADLVGAAVLLLVAGIAVIFGPYPAAFSGEDGLRIRNPFRAIELPWPTITDVKTGLSFVVFAGQRKYTVYAIPVSLRDMRKADKQRYRAASRRQREATRAASGRGGGAFGSGTSGGGAGGDGPEQGLYHDQAVLEINGRRETYASRLKREEIARAHGFTPAGKRIDKNADTADKAADATAQAAGTTDPETAMTAPDTAVTVKWSVVPLALIAVPVLLIIIAAIAK
jgi:hypothetical protein